ncbi:MAG: AraC family transcriptional regulator ligand-binding domain-containing protein [Oleiphilaceae bacterium]|nr:AraC family transcriptional regulator ligand-binding domain-containing protein [Oleiphilaceae bacterium]
MNQDTPCIPMDHIETCFRLRRHLVMEPGWLEQYTHHPRPEHLASALAQMDEQAFFQQAGLVSQDDPHYRASPRQCVKLADLAIKALDMHHLGLLAGKLLTLSQHGMVGVSAVTHHTLLECAQAISRFSAELFPPLAMTPVIDGALGAFVIRERVDLSPCRPFFPGSGQDPDRGVFRRFWLDADSLWL